MDGHVEGAAPLDAAIKAAFEAEVAERAGNLFAELLAPAPVPGSASADAGAAARRFAVLLARVAFMDPEMAIPVLDAASGDWLAARAAEGLGEAGSPLPRDAAARVEAAAALSRPGVWLPGLAERFWETVGDVAGAGDPGLITARCAAYGEAFTPAHFRRLEAAVLRHPGLAGAVAAGPRPRLALADIAGRPEGSLGWHLHRMIVDNGFDLEVIDTDQFAHLEADYPALHVTSRRILQTHDVWHIVGDFRLSALGEVAISGFQFAQFGQNYSAGFLATVAALGLHRLPAFLVPLVQVMAEGWRHGRLTPPLMPVPWEEMWSTPLDEARRLVGCAPFRSAIPDAPPAL